METLAKSQNLEDAKVKTAVAAQILPLIEDVPSPIERDTYRQQLARLLKVDERSLLGSQRVQQKPRRRAQRIDEPVQQRNPKQNEFGVDKRISNLEAHCLSLLLQQPHRYYELERTLKKCGLDTLGVTDFDSSDHQIIADALFKGLSQDEHETIHFVQENIPESLAERLTQLSGVGIITEKNEDKLFEDLVRSLINLRLIRINALLNQIRFIQSDEETAELDKTDLHSLTLNYTIARGKLDMALAKPVDSI
jgi:DNA primase